MSKQSKQGTRTRTRTGLPPCSSMDSLPEAPTYYPSREEFSDPLAYIERLGRRDSPAFAAGLCKIVPPAGVFAPRFVRDWDTFVFRPRKQPLSELSAQGRMRSQYLDGIQAFWTLRGIDMDPRLRPPVVDRRPLDLYLLRNAVRELGGVDAVTLHKQWASIGRKLRLDSRTCTSISSTLRFHYERWVMPYEDFLARVGPKDALPAAAVAVPFSGMKSFKEEIQGQEHEKKEGAIDMDRGLAPLSPVVADDLVDSPSKKMRLLDDDADIRAKENVCVRCRKDIDDAEVEVAKCVQCQTKYHVACADPPLLPPLNQTLPLWHCLGCITNEFEAQQAEPYGFVDTTYEHTLRSFGAMSSKFKSNYFQMEQEPSPVPGELAKETLPISVVEKEFWRLIESQDDHVEVEYGSDIHTSKTGSGFPFKEEDIQSDSDVQYSKSPWNLNVLPRQALTLLPYFDDNIPGMMVPWIYVGMCFSNFCWHNEDHYTYSINYLHWGEPKTWYGVSGMETEKFEAAMMKLAPDLFEQHPDLLQHLVTMASPIELRKENVNVYRLDQRKGEFVITFPSAYHAGFNHGFNLAEAVNFALPDWLPWGRKSVKLYSKVARNPVFSHEELVFTVAKKYESLSDKIVLALMDELEALRSIYRQQIADATSKNIKPKKQVIFEKIPEDDRSCVKCKFTCYLACVVCHDCKDTIRCIDHADECCSCPSSSKAIHFRYTDTEFDQIISSLKSRVCDIQAWAEKVTKLLQESMSASKIDIQDGKALVSLAKTLNILKGNHPVLDKLCDSIHKTESHSQLGREIVRLGLAALENRPVADFERAFQGSEDLSISKWLKDTDSCSFKISECDEILKLKAKIVDFQGQVKSLLSSSHLRRENAEALLKKGKFLDRLQPIPELSILEQVVQRFVWQSEAEVVNIFPPTLGMTGLTSLIHRGLKLEIDQPYIRPLKSLQATAERWLSRAVKSLTSKSDLGTYQNLIQEASSIPIVFPEVKEMENIVTTVLDWRKEVDAIISQKVNKASQAVWINIQERIAPLPLRGEERLLQIKKVIDKSKALSSRLSKLFIKKGASDSLHDVLGYQSELKEGAQKVLHRLRGKTEKEQEAGDECLCHSTVEGASLQCLVCHKTYHIKCLKSPKDKAASPFLCRSCRRTLRPPFEIVEPLVKEANELPIQIEDLDIITLVHELCLSWNQRANRMIALGRSASKSDVDDLILESEMIEVELGLKKDLQELSTSLDRNILVLPVGLHPSTPPISTPPCPISKTAGNHLRIKFTDTSTRTETVKVEPTQKTTPGAPLKIVIAQPKPTSVSLPVPVPVPVLTGPTAIRKPAAPMQTTPPSQKVPQVKHRHESNGDATIQRGICLCHQPFDPYETPVMVRCAACSGWFHMECVGISQRPPSSEPYSCPRCKA